MGNRERKTYLFETVKRPPKQYRAHKLLRISNLTEAFVNQ